MALFRKLAGQSPILIPNYTPDKWMECDLMRVTKAGFFEEYEVKVSVADFRADSKKGPDPRPKWFGLGGDFDKRTKHERLQAHDTKGPCRFWFVVPVAIAEQVLAELPEWAGLMVCSRGHPRVLKKAPQLHSEKVGHAMLDHVMGIFQWRFWNLKARLPEADFNKDNGFSPYPLPPGPVSDWKPDYEVTPRRVVCAAIRKEGRIIAGARHFDKIMRSQMWETEGRSWWRSAEQGFVDQFGDFMTREEAWDIASHEQQIRRKVSSDGTLYSENLY